MHLSLLVHPLFLDTNICATILTISKQNNKRKTAQSFWLENKFVPTCNTFGNLVKLFQQEEFLVTMHMKATVTLVNWNSVHPTQMDFPSMVNQAKFNQLSM